MIFYMLCVGFLTGSRSMTPIAALCWCAWLTGIYLQQSWASWTTHLLSALAFTFFALGEYIGDIHPKAPSRKGFFPATGRVVFGGLCGAIVATAFGEPIAGGVLFGALGAAAGTWLFYAARMWLAGRCAEPRTAGLLESAFTLVSSALLVWRIEAAAKYLQFVQNK